MSKRALPQKPEPTVDLGYPTGQHGRIPSFANIDEEAEFWDTHDITDYLEESRPVDNPFVRDAQKQWQLTLGLDAADEQEVQTRARALGIEASTLVRMWIRERLEQERKAS